MYLSRKFTVAKIILNETHITAVSPIYLSHKYTILQMMHVSGHKTQKTFMDYIKLSSEEIADEIAAMSKKENDMW